MRRAGLEGRSRTAAACHSAPAQADATVCRADDTADACGFAGGSVGCRARGLLILWSRRSIVAGAKGSDSGARTASAEVVRVATYNIHRGRGLDGQVSLRRIADVLRQIDADVVGVQEIYEAQAEHLARDLEMQLVTGVTVHRSDGAYGNAIFTRLPLQGRGDLRPLRANPRGPGGHSSRPRRSGTRRCTSSTSTWAFEGASARSR